jgi:hypothetical protein
MRVQIDLHRESMFADDYLRNDYFVGLAVGMLDDDHMKKM